MNPATLSVNQVVKRYDNFTAVDALSFEVYPGEVFGLLGPNGAGKTTTIRMIMDIFRPDTGNISVFGEEAGSNRSRIGYLPEERGLYPELKLIDALVYLAELKGTSSATARQHAHRWLERMELTDWEENKVKNLSRGMRQKAQFVSCLTHDPDLLILDEPFQGLDPINVDLIKAVTRELQADGKTIVLSAHQMNLVEALCDRIVLINQGRSVLYGNLADIKQAHSPDAVRLRCPIDPGTLPGVTSVKRQGDTFVVCLDGVTPQELLRTLVRRDVPVEMFELATTPLEEIFINVIKEKPRA